MMLRAVGLVLLFWATGCANSADNQALVDPLKQRLLAREDIALQNLLLARMPAVYSYLDAPYDGPAIEPPLPDLNMLPEDMPPWEDIPEETPAPEPGPTPIQPVPTADETETNPEPAVAL